MTGHALPIDISTNPELKRIVQEVNETKQPRPLTQQNKTVAVIMPATKTTLKKEGAKTRITYEAFLKTAGSLKGLIDADQLKRDISESRKIISRPAIKL